MGADYRKAHKSLICGSSTGSSVVNSTLYMHPSGSPLHTVAREIRARCYICTAGVLRHLRAHCHDPPGAGETFDYTLRLNGAPSALTCQTVNPNTESSDLVNAVAIVPGDYITIEIVSSALAAAGYQTISMEYQT